MTTAHAERLREFHWEPHPEAERLVRGVIEPFVAANPFARSLAERMRAETGTRFEDWLEAVAVPRSSLSRSELERTGFRPAGTDPEGRALFAHPGALFPRIALAPDAARRLYVRVESVVEFLARHGDRERSPVEGAAWSPVRRVRVGDAGANELWAIEQHGTRSLTVPAADPERAGACLEALEAFLLRRRDFAHDADGFEHAAALIDRAVERVGRDLACDLFFHAERAFWQRRNRAAQVQFRRQQRLGLGWANHDHHTYRSSRASFVHLVAVLEKLGFRSRERFYAGSEAGWGAQVLEQDAARIVIFADVDLSPEELIGDFAHEPLPPRSTLGTVGLWCALHGESFLGAGMHHLECQFDFDALTEQLRRDEQVSMMKPFSDFPHLRQAFTDGEIWTVAPSRVERLREAGLISAEEAERFLTSGAVGSHLENLERNGGFKGFNQQGVSEIITATDPRRISSAARSGTS